MAQYDVVVKAVDQTKTAFRGIENGLKNIQTRASQVNDTLDKLGTGLNKVGTIATAALGLAGRSAINFANQVDDIANATDITTRSILGFSAAVQDAGGNSEKALDGLLRLNQNIGEAAAGSATLRKAFAEVGVSLQDLATTSTEDILGKVVTGLGSIDDKSKQAALGTELLGKSLKGVSLGQVADTIGQFSAEAQSAAAAQKKIADATAVVEQAFGRLRNRIAEAIAPLAEYINKLKPDQIDRFIDAVGKLAVAIVGLTAGIKVFQGLAAILTAVAGAWGLFTAGAAIAGAAVATQIFRFGAFAYAVKGAFGVITTGIPFVMKLGGVVTTVGTKGEAFVFILQRIAQTISLLASRFIPLFAGGLLRIVGGLTGIGGVALGVATVIDTVFDTKIIDGFINGVKRAYNAVKEFAGFGDKPIELPGISTAENENELKRLQNRVASAQAAATAGTRREIGNPILEAFKESIAKTREEYALFVGLINSTDLNTAAAAFKRASAAAEELGKVIGQPTALVLRDFGIELAKQEEELRRADIRLNNTAMMAQKFSLELRANNQALIENQMKLDDSAYMAQKFEQELLASSQTLLEQAIRLADVGLQSRIYNDELAKGNLELRDQRQRLGDLVLQQGLFEQAIGKTRLGMDQQKITLQLLNDAYATGRISLTEYSDALGGLNERLLGSNEILARQQSIANDEVAMTLKKKEALDKLIANYKEAGGTGTAAFRKTAEALGANATQIDLIVGSYGSYADSVVERNQMIKDSIFDASKTFVDQFSTAFMQGKGMLKSFGDFFTNIINDIAAQLIRQQIATPIANAMGSWLGSMIPGLATGGTATANQPYVIGERGPELFVPNRTGTVVPNDKLAMAGAADSGNGPLTVNFTINAVDTQTGVQFLLQNKPVITSMISDAYNRRGRRGPLD